MTEYHPGQALTVQDIARMIDHSLLRPTLTDDEFCEGIELAIQYKTATVCVAPYDVPRSVSMLTGSEVRVSTVVDFPHGSNLTASKVFEAEQAMDCGAVELDMVLAISRLVSGQHGYVEQDVRAVVATAHRRGAVVKVIFETCFLTPEMTVAGRRLHDQPGADFVTTPTRYWSRGASLEDVRLMRQSCSPLVDVKAAGGIRTLDDVLAYRQAGAKMIGTRGTAAILDEAVRRVEAGTLCDLP
jgi:deoxyribose-phosphate aldolase